MPHLHCSEEHETPWKHPELVLTPDLGWESKGFLETVAFQLRPEACLEWQNKEHSDRGMCTETGGEMERGHDRNWKKLVHIAYIVRGNETREVSTT